MRVNPIGPVPCQGMIIGEGPGREEDETGIPFVGKSGLLLDTALFLNGFVREQFYITNVVKERLTKKDGTDRPPTDAEFLAAMPELEQEIIDVDPQFILLVGATAGKIFPQLWLTAHHGQAFPFREGPEETRWAMLSYHPAAGLHRQALNPHFAYDVGRFCELLKNRFTEDHFGKPWWHQGRYPAPQSRLIRQPVVLGGKVAVDTEGSEKELFCVSYSGVRGEGRVSMPGSVLIHPGTRVIFHYALHDMLVLDSNGFRTFEWDIDCTMLKAYNLSIEPQALKDLVARHLGRSRPEYRELVKPWHERKLWILAEEANGHWTLAKEQEKASKKKKEPVSADVQAVLAANKWAYAATRDKAKGAVVHIENRFKANDIPIPKTDLNDVPEEEWVPYACDDAADTLLVDDVLTEKLKAMGLWDCYEMDRAVLPMLLEMQKNGMPVDIDAVLHLKEEFDAERDLHRKVMSDVSVAAGGSPDVNPAYPPDVAEVLSRLGRSTRRRTRGGGESTDERALSLMLADIQNRKKLGPRYLSSSDIQSETFIKALQEYRELGVYSSNHCAGLLRFYRPESQTVWYRFKYTRTTSGRFSTGRRGEDTAEEGEQSLEELEDGFNALNVPSRTDRGKRVRKTCKAPDGWLLASADLSQIELRVAAHCSQDRAMLEAFRNGLDLHSVTTALLFGIPLDQVKDHPNKRYAAKTINFAILYGISAQALYEQLRAAGITEFDLAACADLIAKWFAAYPGIRAYFDSVLAQTRRDGFVRDMWGRIRYLPNIYLPGDDWRGKQLRAEAERHACNHVIQSGATGIIKRAMANLWRDVLLPLLRCNDGDFLRPLLQIHDELVFLVREGSEDIAKELVGWAMIQDAPMFSVPLKSDWAVGKNWGEL